MKKLLLILVCVLTSMNLAQAQCDLNFEYVNTGTNMTAFFTPPAASAIHAELGDGTIGSFYTDADGSLICAASAAFNMAFRLSRARLSCTLVKRLGSRSIAKTEPRS